LRWTAAILLLISTSAAAAEVDPEAPSLIVLAMKDGKPVLAPQVKVGEPFHIVVTVTPKPDVVVGMPASFGTGAFEVLDRKETANPIDHTFDLTAVAWETGKQKFPPIPVTYVPKGQGQLKTISTNELEVEVIAVLDAEDKEAQLEPIAPPVPIMRKDWTLVIAAATGLGAVLVAGAVLLVVRRVRRRRRAAVAAAPVVDLRPPHEIALEKLRALAASPLLDAVDRKPFYFAVTEVVRDYLGKRHGFAALDMTTSELFAALGGGRPELERWFADCDMVKFARAPASRDDARAAVAAAIGLVEAEIPKPEQPEAPRAAS
jgi:hypothetical protein